MIVKNSKSIDDVKSEITNSFLFCDNSIIEGVGISKDVNGEFIAIYTKDVLFAESKIKSDNYRLVFYKTDGFKAQ